MKFTQEDFWETMQTLGWDTNDDIHIEIGGTSVYEIIERNVEKLKARYPGGEFDVHYSENRQEGDV